jgi:hypothetical protein
MPNFRAIYLTGALITACAAATIAVAAPGDAVTPRNAAELRLTRLVEQHIEAQRDYDQQKLRDLTAEEYLEVSPRGELDPRAKMLSFYAVRPETPSPKISTTFRFIQQYGQVGVVVATLTMHAPDNSPARSMQGTYTARCVGAVCKLLSAQYTPVR